MKVKYEARSRQSVDQMDWESKDALKKALELVKDKTGFKTIHETWKDCTLIVSIGHNIYTTSFEIHPPEKAFYDKRRKWHNGSAYFCNGVFWASLSRIKVELI